MTRAALVIARTAVDRAVADLEAGVPANDSRSASRLILLDRRRFLLASGSSLAAALLAACNSSGPESAGRILAYATRKNEAVDRWLIRHTAMDHASAAVAGNAFPSYFISPTVPVWDPTVRGEWALVVDGLVRRPLRLTLEQLAALPRRTQRVNHYCVEGWNAVAVWRGVQMRELARLVSPLPGAAYVDFRSFDDGYHESWDMESAMHPQTLVAYAKDGRYLPPAYGAPARLHSPVKLGYKNTKYLTRVTFMAERNGGYWSDRGYEWHGGT